MIIFYFIIVYVNIFLIIIFFQWIDFWLEVFLAWLGPRHRSWHMQFRILHFLKDQHEWSPFKFPAVAVCVCIGVGLPRSPRFTVQVPHRLVARCSAAATHNLPKHGSVGLLGGLASRVAGQWVTRHGQFSPSSRGLLGQSENKSQS